MCLGVSNGFAGTQLTWLVKYSGIYIKKNNDLNEAVEWVAEKLKKCSSHDNKLSLTYSVYENNQIRFIPKFFDLFKEKISNVIFDPPIGSESKEKANISTFLSEDTVKRLIGCNLDGLDISTYKIKTTEEEINSFVAILKKLN